MRLSRQALKINPGNPDALKVAGFSAFRLNRGDDAVRYFTGRTKQRPDDLEAWSDLGGALLSIGRFGEAETAYRQVLARKPDDVLVLSELGQVLRELERYEEAEAVSRRALDIDPANAQAHNNPGLVLDSQGRYEEALAVYREAVRLNPHFHEAAGNLEGSLLTLLRYDEMEDIYKRQNQRRPGRSPGVDGSRCGLPRHRPVRRGGETLSRRHRCGAGRSRRLTAAFQRAVPERRTGGRMALLRAPGVVHGRRSGAIQPAALARPGTRRQRHFGARRARGRRRGELFLFPARPQEDGGRRRLRVQPSAGRPFPPVLSRRHGHPGIGRGGRRRRRTAAALPDPTLRSRFFPAQDVRRLPAKAELWADAERAAVFRRRYREAGDDFLVGLAWRSVNPKIGRKKSVSPKVLAPLTRIPGVRFIDLQYGDTADDLATIKAETGIEVYHDDSFDQIEDLESFAAQVAALDLVISISNTTVHMAGALGIPTWILVPYVPFRRWFMDRDDSPWYPSARVIRQPTQGDWPGVIERAHRALQSVAARQR